VKHLSILRQHRVCCLIYPTRLYQSLLYQRCQQTTSSSYALSVSSLVRQEFAWVLCLLHNKYSKFEKQIPLWSINGPALYLASKAFADHDWQTEHQAKLAVSEQLTTELFRPLEHEKCFHQRLCSSYALPKKLALTIYKHFYEAGILLRLIDISEDKSILRIGRIKAKDTLAQDRIRSVFSSLITTQQSAR
jgi:hypothetical protein